MPFHLTAFQSPVGDHNNLAIPGALAVATEISQYLAIDVQRIGTPAPALNTGWEIELESARPALAQLQAHFEKIYSQGGISIAAISRCAASIATLPVIARHRPDACIVWFDAHADLNTPKSTTSGYLGGLALSAPLGLWDSGFGAGLKMENVILVGQRDIDPFELDLMRSKAIRHIRPCARVGEEIREAVGGRPVYVHLDCDVLNPGIVPTEYVHDAGLSLDDLRHAADALAQSELVGLEISEFQYSWTTGGEAVSAQPLINSLRALLQKPKA